MTGRTVPAGFVRSRRQSRDAWIKTTHVAELIGDRRIKSLVGPWGRVDAYQVITILGERAVVKRWSAEQTDRCRAECRALIGSSDSPLTPSLLPLGGVRGALALAEGGWVTARSYLEGTCFEGETPQDFVILGRALRQLHEDLAGCHPPAESRLARVARARCASRSSVLSNALSRAHVVLDPYWHRLASLPRSVVHGDPNWANIIVSNTGTAFIDFEFSRHDLRVLDLVPAFAGGRDPRTGRFEVSGPEAVLAVANGYDVGTSLTEAERELLPAACLAFFVMVGHDLAAAGGFESRGVEEIIKAAASWVSSTGSF